MVTGELWNSFVLRVRTQTSVVYAPLRLYDTIARYLYIVKSWWKWLGFICCLSFFFSLANRSAHYNCVLRWISESTGCKRKVWKKSHVYSPPKGLPARIGDGKIQSGHGVHVREGKIGQMRESFAARVFGTRSIRAHRAWTRRVTGRLSLVVVCFLFSSNPARETLQKIVGQIRAQ